MKIFSGIILALVLGFLSIQAVVFFTETDAAAGSTPDKIENFTLPDYNGNEVSLSDFTDSKAIVIIFVATQCPVSNDYNSRMSQIHKEYESKGISFIGINSNKQEDSEEIKEHAKENDLGFVILKDKNNVIADKFEAKVTPEVFILDSEFNVHYHGRIDDDRSGEEIESHDLKAALDEILAGNEVTIKETKAFGCSIKRVD